MGSRRTRGWQQVRFALGMAQIFFGTMALILLVRDGLTSAAMSTTVVTCLCTTASLVLFGRRGPFDR